jgi:hypothetical protein
MFEFGLQETQAASANVRPNLHSKLGASQSFSRKITKNYLLKLIIPIIKYNHSMLRSPDSKRRVDISRITTQFVYFSLLIFD